MPYIAQTRSDIPNGVLQVLDLWPYTSQRSIYDPPGQTKYINRGEYTGANQNAARPTTVSGASTQAYDVYGLAAYIADTINAVTTGATFFTADEANTAATNIAARVDTGVKMEAGDINTILAAVNGGSGLVGTGTSTGTLADMLRIIAGGSYLLPAGSAIGGVAAAMGNGAFVDGTYKATVDGQALAASFAAGSLSSYTAGTFSYDGTAGQALVVYNDDGTLYT